VGQPDLLARGDGEGVHEVAPEARDRLFELDEGAVAVLVQRALGEVDVARAHVGLAEPFGGLTPLHGGPAPVLEGAELALQVREAVEAPHQALREPRGTRERLEQIEDGLLVVVLREELDDGTAIHDISPSCWSKVGVGSA
jgi:hypothetical protein